MMRSLALHAALLVGSIAIATYAWVGNQAPEADAGEPDPIIRDDKVVGATFTTAKKSLVVVVEGEKDAYEAVATFEGPKRRELADGEHAHDDKHEEEHADAGPTKAHEEEVEKRRVVFPVDKNLIRALTHLAPLVPRRRIGDAPADKLEKMGLNGETILTVKTASGSTKLELGNAAYGGAAHYARLASGAVVLLPARAVKPFALPPERLMKRRLFDVDLSDITGLTLMLGKKSATFEHVEREQRAKRYFALAGDGPSSERRSDEATSVVGELRTLRVSDFLDETVLEGLSPTATVRLERVNAAALEGALYETADKNGYILKSGRWVGSVSLAKGRSLVEELSLAVPLAPADATSDDEDKRR